MYTAESQSNVLFGFQRVTCNYFNKFLSILNMHCIYTTEPTKLNLTKKSSKSNKNWPIYSIFYSYFSVKKNGVTERSSDFTVIRKFVFSSKLWYKMIFCMFWHSITSLTTLYNNLRGWYELWSSSTLTIKSSIVTDFDFLNESPTKPGAEIYMVMAKLTSLALSLCRYLWTVTNNNNDAQSTYVCDHRCQTKLHIFSGKMEIYVLPIFLQN